MIASNDKRIRVVQVVHGLVVGGIESWLVNVLQRIDRDRFQVDFITSRPEPCYYDDEVRALGAQIHFCPSPRKPWIYGPAFRKIIKQGGYSVVHAHVDHYSGFVMRLAKSVGVKTRITHSHSNTTRNQAKAGMFRRIYLGSAKRWIRTSATVGLAVSDVAGASLFPRWGNDDRWDVLHCGINTAGFHHPVDRSALRQHYGIPEDAFVFGHIGGFREPKNHRFLVEIAAALKKRDPSIRMLLVGDGPLRPEIEAQVRGAGVEEQVVFTGIVRDVTTVLRGAMDAFVFPSLWEGAPLAVLEAQATGIPTLMSTAVTNEIAHIPSLVQQKSLDDSADDWADALMTMAQRPREFTPAEALARIEASRFNVDNAVRKLEALYAGQ